MSQKRVSSKLKQKQQQTKLLEEQTKKMQEKLAALRQQVQQQKKFKQSVNYESTLTKWKKATNTQAPLKDYAKKVLADRKQALNKFGIDEKKIMGSKSFQPVLSKLKSEKREQQEKDITRIPKFEVSLGVEKKKEQQLPIQSIQGNFFKARITTKAVIQRKTLEQLLEEIFLQQYLPVFKSNSINDIDDLYHMNRQKMGEVGIKPGHQNKIIKKVKQQIQGKSSTKDTNENQKNVQNKVSFGYGEGDVNQYKILNDIEDNHKTLIKEHNQNEEKGQRSNHRNESDESNYEEQEDDIVIITMPQMSEFSIQANTEAEINNIGEVAVEQFNCFQCYRRVKEEIFQSTDERKFCSQSCLKKYLLLMQKNCPQCDELFYKFNGFFQEGLWFCSLKCCPNQERIQQMFFDWKRQQQEHPHL